MNPVIQALEAEVARLETVAAAAVAKLSVPAEMTASEVQAIQSLAGRIKAAVDPLAAAA